MSNARSLASFLSSTPTADFNFDSNSLVVDISENTVGIGDTTPDGKLEVRQTASADILNLYDDTTNVLTVVDGGNVGIGDDSPDGKLEVRQSGTDDIFNLYDDTTNVLTVVDGGKVGIGTSTPDGLVDIRQSGTDDILNLYDGTNNVLTVVDGGKVGIKSSTPDGMLDVRSLTSDDIFNLYDGSTNVFTVIDGGNVGIGTSTPSQIFTIAGTGGTTAARIENFGTNAAQGAQMLLARSNSGTLGTQTAVDADDLLGALDFQGSTGTSFVTGARIEGYADETFSGTASGSTLRFYTADTTTNTLDERVRIDHNGNVGIGTTVPDNLFHTYLSSSSANSPSVKFENGESNTGAYDEIVRIEWGGDDDVHGDAFYLRFRDSNGYTGGVTSGGSGSVNFDTSSDYRIKENVTDLTNGLERVLQLRPKRFNYIGNKAKIKQDGFIAHEVDEASEDNSYLVTGQKDATFDNNGTEEINPQSLDYGRFTPMLVAAIQELSAKVTALENAQST